MRRHKIIIPRFFYMLVWVKNKILSYCTPVYQVYKYLNISFQKYLLVAGAQQNAHVNISANIEDRHLPLSLLHYVSLGCLFPTHLPPNHVMKSFFEKSTNLTHRPPRRYCIIQNDISEPLTCFKGIGAPSEPSPETFPAKTRSPTSPPSKSEIFLGGGGGGPFSAPPLYCRRGSNPRSWPARPAS